MLQNALNCTIQFFFIGVACLRTPVACTWLRPNLKKVDPLAKSCIVALKNYMYIND